MGAGPSTGAESRARERGAAAGPSPGPVRSGGTSASAERQRPRSRRARPARLFRRRREEEPSREGHREPTGSSPGAQRDHAAAQTRSARGADEGGEGRPPGPGALGGFAGAVVLLRAPPAARDRLQGALPGGAEGGQDLRLVRLRAQQAPGPAGGTGRFRELRSPGRFRGFLAWGLRGGSRGTPGLGTPGVAGGLRNPEGVWGIRRHRGTPGLGIPSVAPGGLRGKWDWEALG